MSERARRYRLSCFSVALPCPLRDVEFDAGLFLQVRTASTGSKRCARPMRCASEMSLNPNGSVDLKLH